MPTPEDIISEEIHKEGPTTNDPADHGGRTQFGISEAANPQAWVDGKVTEAEARAIYMAKYVQPFLGIVDQALLAQAVDFAVTSGVQLVVMKIQEIVGEKVDGNLGPKTLTAINITLGVNNKLVVARLKMIGRILSRDKSQAKYALGWISRACEFLV